MAEKNPHAVTLGRLGGKKGGLARAAVLSPERRSEIASQGGRARWQKNCQHNFYYPVVGRRSNIAHCWYCDIEFSISELFSVPCQHCSAEAGNPCRAPSGYRTPHPHTVRVSAFIIANHPGSKVVREGEAE